MNIEDEPAQQAKKKYPKIVFLIILNEFCERFSYYGLRTVLFLFFFKFVGLSEDTSTVIYHAFTVLCYFTPILGAVLADGYIGLYKTILSLSCLYFIGEVILALTSMVPLGAPEVYGPCVGLFIIAIGTGGIKPCVSAFGGNQFYSDQKQYLTNFFSLFYLSINIGSTIGTLLTPVLRSDVKCFGNDCYPLAFGIPAVFMLVAIVFFVIGTKWYRRDNDKTKGSANVITQTFGCIFSAIKNKIVSKKTKKEHWLDYADVKYSKEIISDVKAFCRVLFVFLPLPIFWALYDQQGSRWTSQAQQLNGNIGPINIKPDQFQSINPILIIILVPCFDYLIYPGLAKIGLLKRPLQRMSTGMFLAIIAFLIAALLEWQMQTKSASLNINNSLKIINLSPCDLKIDYNEHINYLDASKHKNINQLNLAFSNVSTLKINASCNLISNYSQINKIITVDTTSLPSRLILSLSEKELKHSLVPYNINNQKIGFSQIRFLAYNLDSKSLDVKIEKLGLGVTAIGINQDLSSNVNYTTIENSKYDLKLFNKTTGDILLLEPINLESCARYTILAFPSVTNRTSIDFLLLTDIYPNNLSIFWQVIQIFVMTVGEIMFSISGLTFAYSQAPISMKSMLSASWCLTVAVGNLVVVIVAESKFVDNQVYEYILFAGLLLIATILFMILSYFYKYNNDTIQENLPDDTLKSNLKQINKKDSLKSQTSENIFIKGFDPIASDDVKLIKATRLSE